MKKTEGNTSQNKKSISLRTKIWDVAYPFVFFLLCMCIVTIAAICVGDLLTGTIAMSMEALSQIVKGLPLFVNIGFYSLTLLMQRKNYMIDSMRLNHWQAKWSRKVSTAGVIACICFGNLYSHMITSGFWMKLFPGYSQNAASAFEGQNIFLLVAATVILAPLAEELIFRGMIYRRARSYWGPAAALVISALLFAVYHGNMVQGAYALGLGVMLAWLYEKSHSLWTSIAAHAALNALAIADAFLLELLAGGIRYLYIGQLVLAILMLAYIVFYENT